MSVMRTARTASGRGLLATPSSGIRRMRRVAALSTREPPKGTPMLRTTAIRTRVDSATAAITAGGVGHLMTP